MHGKDLTLVSGLTNSNYNADPPARSGGLARVRMGGAPEFGRRSQDVPDPVGRFSPSPVLLAAIENLAAWNSFL
jgi:hypothetical protein